jgi:hypothetical protein
VPPVRSGVRDGADLRSGTGAVLARGAPYSMPSAALEKWSRERLQLRVLPDRTIEARFRYDGTTCSNLGQPLAFDYHVRLSSPEAGLTVTEARCAPAPEDTGHTSMCRYLVERSSFLDTIAAERPLIGCPLDDVLAWRREPSPAGCFCDARARAHKWGLVFEVLHYTLAKPVTDDPA